MGNEQHTQQHLRVVIQSVWPQQTFTSQMKHLHTS